MARYVKDFSNQEQDSKKKFSFPKIFLIIFIILLALFIFVFPHKKYASYTTNGKVVVAVNSITHIGYYLEYDLVTENVGGVIKGKWQLKDKAVITFVKQKELGKDVYYNEEKGILLEINDEGEEEEMSLQEIFFKAIFG